MFRLTPSFSFVRALVFASAFMVSIPIGAQTFEPEVFDFCDVPVGSVSAPQVFVFTNTQLGAIEVTDVFFVDPDADQFAIVDTDCVGLVPPSGTCDVTATYVPSKAGPVQTFLFLDAISGSGIESRYPVEVSGNGVDLPVSAADLALQLGLDDTNAVPGQALTLSAQVQNLGPDGATDVALSIELPAASAGTATANGAGWVCTLNASTFTCTRPVLAALALAPLTVEFDAPQTAGDYIIDGDVASETPDPALANNSDQAAFGVEELPPPPPPPSQALARQIPATGSLAAVLLIVGALLVAWRNRQG